MTNEADNSVETYTGLTANPFKKRVRQHETDIKNYRPHDPDNHKSGTRLSRHCGQLVARRIPYTITWKILKETKTNFNPTTGFCVLCANEKFLIMFKPEDATLNLRSGFFSHSPLPSRVLAPPQKIIISKLSSCLCFIYIYVIIFYFWSSLRTQFIC